MGERGPLPKDQRVRDRDNAQRDSLVQDDVVRGPELPEGMLDEGWHPMVVRWWEAFRRSPMAQRVQADVQWESLIGAMVVYNDLWYGESRGRAMRLTEFRAWFTSYFITPGDLRRNGLEIVEPAPDEDEQSGTGTDVTAAGGNVSSLDARRARLAGEATG